MTLIERAAPLAPTAHPRLDLAALADIVGGLATATDLWRPYVQHDPVERARVRLLATTAYEVWLIGWTPGQAVGLHDHGGSHGAYVVVDGTLTESLAAPHGALVDTAVPAGSGGVLAAGVVHDLANRTAGLATSLHAYSRPLRSMGFFETARPGLRGHRIRTHWVDDVGAIW